MTLPLQQLPLDIIQAPTPSFNNFIVGHNQEVLSALVALPLALQATATPPAQRLLYLWGESGSGRTHLLHAIAKRSGVTVRTLDATTALEDFTHHPDYAIYCIDDVDQLNADQQIALFNLYNAVRAEPRHALIATGAQAPLGLTVREDLRTRLGWGLVYQIHALDDADKIAALQTAAKERGLVLSAEVPAWLLTHFYRDMPSLMALLDALDTYSLEQKRAVTLPLVKQLLGRM